MPEIDINKRLETLEYVVANLCACIFSIENGKDAFRFADRKALEDAADGAFNDITVPHDESGKVDYYANV